MLTNALYRTAHIVILAVAGCGAGLQAGPGAYRSIPDLVAGSDVIVVGQVLSFDKSQGTLQGRLVVMPEEILKGGFPDGVVVLSFQGANLSRGQGVIGKRVLVFAKKAEGTSNLAVVPLVDAAETTLEEQLLITSAKVDPSLEKRADDTALQRVIKEFFNSQLNSTSKNLFVYLMPLAWSRVEPGLTATAFRTLLASSTADGVITGTAGLVALGDVEGLQSLESPQIQGHAELPRLLSDVERFYSSPSVSGVEILSRWLGSDQAADKRHAAAGALAQVHSATAILSLGNALNDADFEVRWRAIGGLSLFANNVPIRGVAPAAGDWQFRSPSTARFSVFDRDVVRKDEQRYLDFWRSWWSENQAAISKLSASERR